jgi:hypothetical protein
MRSFHVHQSSSWLRWVGSLACWPLLAVAACSVYDDSLVGDAAAPLGGSETGAGNNAGGSASVAGSAVGADGGGGVAQGGSLGAVGAGSGGKAGDGESGSAGTPSGGGAGGSSGTASGGSGGEPATGPTEIIDGMEDGDAEIEPAGPRNGYWYVGHDLTAGTTDPTSAKFTMTELAANDRSLYAAHLKAANFTDWGSVMGFNFVEQLGDVKPYDGSAYCGVQFWAKAAAATTVRFRVPDIDTHQSGGVCTNPGTTGTACYDHFGASAGFTTAWKSFSFQFANLTQTGSGYHPADGKLKSDQLFAVEWALPGNDKTYEIWIDDVEFIKCP